MKHRAINNRVNLYHSIGDSYLTDVSASEDRNVGEQFAHLHNIRLMWLKASEPCLAEGLQKIENSDIITKKLLATSFTGSSLVREKLLQQDSKKKE